MKPAATTCARASQRREFDAHGIRCIFGVTTPSKSLGEAHRRSRLRVHRRGRDLRRRPDDPEATLRRLRPRGTGLRRTAAPLAAPGLCRDAGRAPLDDAARGVRHLRRDHRTRSIGSAREPVHVRLRGDCRSPGRASDPSASSHGRSPLTSMASSSTRGRVCRTSAAIGMNSVSAARTPCSTTQRDARMMRAWTSTVVQREAGCSTVGSGTVSGPTSRASSLASRRARVVAQNFGASSR